MNNLKVNRNLLQQANETSEGQHPFAIILSCIDSRTSVELIFDQGLGDVFSARIAGSIINDDILGSMEFACKLAGAKIIVILGHSKCGAIKGACDQVKLDHLTGLLQKIEPAVREGKAIQSEKPLNEEAFVAKVTEINVHHSVKTVLSLSSVIRELVDQGQCGIIGGNHDITSGEVTFFEDTMAGFF